MITYGHALGSVNNQSVKKKTTENATSHNHAEFSAHKQHMYSGTELLTSSNVASMRNEIHVF